MKKIIKNITPPFLYDFARKVLNRKNFRPQWNTLDYEPVNGIKMFFDPSGPWQTRILDGSYDQFLFNNIERLNPAGKVIFDIGAHVGFHSIYFAKLVGKKGKVCSFEPHPQNYERLIVNVKKNADVEPIISAFNVAVSDKDGVESFTFNDNIESGRSSGNFIGSADTIWEKDVFRKKGFIDSKINTVMIDSIDKHYNIKDLPDIIKIDVEGAEYNVLLGAKNTIERKRPVIFVEIHSTLSMFKVMSFLDSMKYSLQIINKELDGRCFIEARHKNEG